MCLLLLSAVLEERERVGVTTMEDEEEEEECVVDRGMER